jgi:hypothetical protein
MVFLGREVPYLVVGEKGVVNRGLEACNQFAIAILASSVDLSLVERDQDILCFSGIKWEVVVLDLVL